MALYRAFRPSEFDSVVGQDENTTVLKEQIKNKNWSHAYLFVGSHGTGKTSSAKILSRAVNCENPVNGNPCNECSTCKGILNESILDVVEIDAASNNGVDNIRDLIEKAAYVPSKAKYKVYIIDEVHMLSTGAFNALLKTLEEPPSHCIFILCTTEFHKVPGTIRSRCQIFNFKQIATNAMLDRMQYVCGEVGVIADTDALSLIANNANGAMRDALSILDQCMSKKAHITEQLVKDTLGILDNSIILQAADSLLQKDASGALGFLKQVVFLGKSISQFVENLLCIFRDTMILKTTNDVDSISNTQYYKDTVFSLKDNASLERIIHIITEITDVKNKIKGDINPRIRLEMTFIKLTASMFSEDYSELVAEVKELRREVNLLKSSGKVVEVEKRVEYVVPGGEPMNLDSFMVESDRASYKQSSDTEINVEEPPNENTEDSFADLSEEHEPLLTFFINNNDEKKAEAATNEVEEDTPPEQQIAQLKSSLSEDILIATCLSDCSLVLNDNELIIKTEIPGIYFALQQLTKTNSIFEKLETSYKIERI